MTSSTRALRTSPAGQQTTRISGTAQQVLRERFTPRAADQTWPATAEPRTTVLERLKALYEDGRTNSNWVRFHFAEHLMGWLETVPGDTWQRRWHNSAAESHLNTWPQIFADWMRDQGHNPSQIGLRKAGALALIRADVIRPSLGWFLLNRSAYYREIASIHRDPEGVADLASVAGERLWASRLGTQAHYQIAVLLLSKGGLVRDITVGDCLELKDTEAQHYRDPTGRSLFYTWLRDLQMFPSDAPATLRAITMHTGRLGVSQLVDRYRLQCRPVRDVLVDYLQEREPSLDYSSLVTLARTLAKHFWADLERHHPGIDSFILPPEVSSEWKQRVRFKTTHRKASDGSKIEVSTERMSAMDLLNTVRAFYLDIAQWAVEEPSRWGPWAAPCPIKASEIEFKKRAKQQKSRMDRRTRERLPMLPILVRTAEERLKAAQQRLTAVLAADPGESFTVLGETFTRVRASRERSGENRSTAAYLASGKLIHLGQAEHRAFWAWATVEFLRHSGVRIEEMLETSHHSLIQYTLPTTGQVVPLLQIAPSKTDEERVLLVTPELADVLSAIVQRVRSTNGQIPLVDSYDPSEHTWNPPMPLLFQWRSGGENRGVSQMSIRKALNETLAAADITDTAGQRLHYQPHDFRRIFVTDAVANGLPPHIAMIICGHKDISTTMGYKAIYPTEAIEAHRAFIARRRRLRPSEEYRTPTADEWDAFLGHFEKRKLSLGTCGRAYGTSCIHEHACVRCPMLRPDPNERARLEEIRDNLVARITEAEREGWLGDVEGLQTSLEATHDKLGQLDSEVSRKSLVIDLGIPTFSQVSSRCEPTPTSKEGEGRTAASRPVIHDQN